MIHARPGSGNRSHSLLLSLGLSLSVFAGCAEKPVLELQQAREALAAARDFEADIYAPGEFEMARLNLDSGEFAISEQEQAPSWSRNYTLSLEFLALAIEQAGHAQSIAEASKTSVFEGAGSALPRARVGFQAAFEAVEAARGGPVTRRGLEALDDELAGIFATLDQAEDTYENGDYSGALILFQEVQEKSEVLASGALRIADLAGQ